MPITTSNCDFSEFVNCNGCFTTVKCIFCLFISKIIHHFYDVLFRSRKCMSRQAPCMTEPSFATAQHCTALGHYGHRRVVTGVALKTICWLPLESSNDKLRQFLEKLNEQLRSDFLFSLVTTSPQQPCRMTIVQLGEPGRVGVVGPTHTHNSLSCMAVILPCFLSYAKHPLRRTVAWIYDKFKIPVRPPLHIWYSCAFLECHFREVRLRAS